MPSLCCVGDWELKPVELVNRRTPERAARTMDEAVGMESFEDKLKRAMKRTEAPDGFVEQVVARVGQEQLVSSKTPRQVSVIWWQFWRLSWHPALLGVFAGVTLAMLGLWFGYRQQSANPDGTLQQEQIHGKQMSAELMLALHITGTQLARVHELLWSAPIQDTTAEVNRTAVSSTR